MVILIYRLFNFVSFTLTRHYFAGAAVIENSKVKIIQISISWSARNQTGQQTNEQFSQIL